MIIPTSLKKYSTQNRDSQIASQISVLNQDYADTGLTFVLSKTIRTTNSDWFNNVGPDDDLQTDMKTQLRQGGAAELNLYSVGFKSGSGEGLLGYSTFPSDYDSNPDDDGVVFLFSSVPGGETENYNGGRVSSLILIHLNANTRFIQMLIKYYKSLF